jgi:hypothetical protein
MGFKKLFQCLLMVMAFMTVAIPGQAAMVPTAQMVSDVTGIELGNVVEQRNWIREQLVIGGVSEADAAMRVDALTDQQVAELHQRIDQEPAGGNVLVWLIVILLVSELAGWTDIFTFIEPID